jgi:hypothetical protein
MITRSCPFVSWFSIVFRHVMDPLDKWTAIYAFEDKFKTNFQHGMLLASMQTPLLRQNSVELSD